MLVDGHLHVQAVKFAEVAVRVAVLRAEDGPDLEDVAAAHQTTPAAVIAAPAWSWGRGIIGFTIRPCGGFGDWHSC